MRSAIYRRSLDVFQKERVGVVVYRRSCLEKGRCDDDENDDDELCVRRRDLT